VSSKEIPPIRQRVVDLASQVKWHRFFTASLEQVQGELEQGALCIDVGLERFQQRRLLLSRDFGYWASTLPLLRHFCRDLAVLFDALTIPRVHSGTV
jgi:hypothetical protein